MLQENRPVRRILILVACVAVCAFPSGADAPAAAPIVPLTVCEVVRDLPSQAGKTIAVLGRYSYRESGASPTGWISQDTCGAPAEGQPQVPPPELWMVVDRNAPRLPEDYELDGAAMHRKLAEVQRHTTLAKFRFGTPDYDRWAVVWGRVEARKPDESRKAAANLIYRGEGVIYTITQ